MKILIATQCFPPDFGGIEHVMGNIAINAFKLNHQVTVICDQSKNPSQNFDEENKFSIKRFGQIKYFRRLKKANYINDLISNENYDCIFFDSWKSSEFISSNNQANKFICLVHGNEILKHKNQKRIIESISKANTIVFNSKATQSLFLRKFVNFKINKSKIIYPAFIQKIEQTINEKKMYDFCTISRLDRRKGHYQVLEALKKLKDNDNILASYAILGSGDEIGILKSMVQKLSLQNQVFFLSESSNPDEVLNKSKIHLLPTFLDGNSIEGFGISNVEAASKGVPCIVSDSGGTPESIIPNQTGLVVQQKNLNALYLGMKNLLMNKELYREFSSNSLSFAKNFLKEKKILEYLDNF